MNEILEALENLRNVCDRVLRDRQYAEIAALGSAASINEAFDSVGRAVEAQKRACKS